MHCHSFDDFVAIRKVIVEYGHKNIDFFKKIHYIERINTKMLLRQNLRGCLLHDVGLCKEILISLVYAMIVLHEKSTLCNIVSHC